MDRLELLSTELIAALRNASSVTVLTGAGISAESGVPTFRDALTGLWAKFDPAQLATPEAFERDPATVSRWYDQRRIACAACQPNDGHRALARMQQALSERGRQFTLVTQNVDRLHQRAGSSGVLELHGSLAVWRCTACGVQREETGPAFEDHPPRCACGGARRPGVVWFGEFLPEDTLMLATERAAACDVFLSVGTSAIVYPAAGIIEVAIASPATTVEINTDPTPLSSMMTHVLRGCSSRILSEIADLFDGAGRSS